MPSGLKTFISYSMGTGSPFRKRGKAQGSSPTTHEYNDIVSEIDAEISRLQQVKSSWPIPIRRGDVTCNRWASSAKSRACTHNPIHQRIFRCRFLRFLAVM